MTRTADEILKQEFLEVRAKLLEIGAFFDRLHRAGNEPLSDQQLDLLRQGCRLLNDEEPEKAARLQLLFSRPYDQDWRSEWGV
ncbi:MAG: hypothetical protein KatS3mg111_3399 [Pirellulaceae bacterium]|nr:MAG: hypothetical protein KatS3mg111_3399 [Pirellulaceae bacterium]